MLSLSLSLSLCFRLTHAAPRQYCLTRASQAFGHPATQRRGAIGLHLLAQPQRVPRQAIDIDSFPSERPSLGPPRARPSSELPPRGFFREFRSEKGGDQRVPVGQTTREKSADSYQEAAGKLVEQVEVTRAASQASAGRSVHARNGGDVSVSERLWSSYFST